MKKGYHYLRFEIVGIAKGEAAGLCGILALCFLAIVAAYAALMLLT
jgi:hypothetical protein